MQPGNIIIGEFYFDETNFTLTKEGQEQALEPKVGALLCYLYQHKARFVSLNELHEQVWSETVVSDTAVRRAISKLRQVLGDNADNPRYIKSLPKRGYRFIASELALKTDSPHIVNDPSVLQLSGGQMTEAPALRGTSFSFQFSYKYLLLLVLTAALVVVGINWNASRMGSTEIAALNTDTMIQLNSLPSEKSSLSLSGSGQFIAFNARSRETEPYTLYLQNVATGEVQQLSDQQGQVDKVAFVSGDRQLVYGENLGTRVNINVLDINWSQRQQARTIYSQEGGYIGDISAIPGENSVLVILGQRDPDSAQVYRLDLQSGEKTPVTRVIHDGVSDYIAELSPDGLYLAYARLENMSKKLFVVDMQTGALKREMVLDRTLYGVAWRDNSRMLLLDKNFLKELYVHSGTMQTLHSNPFGKARQMAMLSEDEVVLRIDEPTQVKIGESQAMHPESFVWLKGTKSGRTMSKYGWERDSFISIDTLPTGSEIVLHRKNGQSSESLLQSNHRLFLYDTNKDRAQLLYSEKGQLWLYSANSGTKQAVTTASQYVLDASLAHSDGGVYLCETRQTRDNCYVQSPNKEQRLIVENANAIREVSGGFIVTRPDGSVEELDQQGNVITTLPFKMQNYEEQHLEVSDHYVVFAGLDLNNNLVNIHVYERNSGDYQQFNRSYDVASAFFDMSEDGKHILQQSWLIQFGDFYIMEL